MPDVSASYLPPVTLILRSAAFNVAFYAVLVGMMLIGLPILLMGRRAVTRYANCWAAVSLWLLRVICGTRTEFRGIANIPAQACIIASKHQSFLEIIALSSMFPEFTFILKRELMRIPVFGWYLAGSGQVAIDRRQGRSALAQAVRAASTVLAQGRQILIFPEGTRRPPGASPDYRFGVAYLYAETGAVCLPVAVNSGLFWPRRSFLRRPGTVVISFLTPLCPGLERAEFHTSLRDRIEAASDALMAEAIEADPRLALATNLRSA